MGILLIGGGIVGGEYILVKWYPAAQRSREKGNVGAHSYKNDGLGIEMQVAAGINGKTECFIRGRPDFFTKILEQGTFHHHHFAAES